MNPLTQLFSKQLFAELSKDLGIDKDPPDMQAAGLSIIGEAVMTHVVVELLQRIPEFEHSRFRELLASGPAEALFSFLNSQIPDIEDFVLKEARKEADAITRRADELARE